jgi:hypothetical protein
MLGSVPVCSFEGTYGWAISGRTLTLEPIADKKCPVRETFFGATGSPGKMNTKSVRPSSQASRFAPLSAAKGSSS